VAQKGTTSGPKDEGGQGEALLEPMLVKPRKWEKDAVRVLKDHLGVCPG